MNLEQKQMKVDDLEQVINHAQKMRDELMAEIKKEKDDSFSKYKEDIMTMVYNTNALIEKYGLDVSHVTVSFHGDTIVGYGAYLLINGVRYHVVDMTNCVSIAKKILINYIERLVCAEINKSI